MLRIEEIYEFHYILKDHLGSWTTITDEVGRLEQELSYDAWGNLRNPGTWCVDATIRPMFERGYTGHEHHVGLGLINMNGRMYDPVMSSFLSVDRYVQNPGNSQGFNRYAYCMYNPLRYTDPSGWLCGPPKSKSGLIQDYLADPCYITRQALRDAGLYDIEGGYGYVCGHGTMCARWKEGDGSANQSSWSIQTESGGMSCGAWAVPSSWNNYETMEGSNGNESNWGNYNQIVGSPTGRGGGSDGKTIAGATNDNVGCPRLLFDGIRLRILGNNGYEIYSFNAFSGKPDKEGFFRYTKWRQMQTKGPIPEGAYYINLSEIQSLSCFNSILGLFSIGPWPGGSVSWGKQRAWIKAFEGTELYGRNGFSIHGGSIPGSYGCIDLLNNEVSFFEMLSRYSKGYDTIELKVRYDYIERK